MQNINFLLFEKIRKFVNFGLEYWGSDQMGVNKTRRFLLEWLSFTCRYIPVGVLEVLPQRINEKPPPFVRLNEMKCVLNLTCIWQFIFEVFKEPRCRYDFTDHLFRGPTVLCRRFGRMRWPYYIRQRHQAVALARRNDEHGSGDGKGGGHHFLCPAFGSSTYTLAC